MSEPVLIGTVVAGRYRVIEQLGRGGMGIVYRVEHVHTGERVALKVLTGAARLHDNTVERFKREARASALIKSEHIVRVTDADVAPELDGTPFLVMELLDGADLEAHVNQSGPIPPARLVEILAEVVEGLSAAHRVGIVHRDLKPENLFLHTRADSVVITKVLDFGISKFSPSAADSPIGLTTTGAFVGTPLYMAPEQANGDNDKISPATDIWALGMVTLRLLVGEHLWGAPSIAELVTKIVVSPLPKPSARWPDHPHMSPALDAWFARSCDRDPAQRWSSVEEQIDALKQALVGASLGVATPRPSDATMVAREVTPPTMTTRARPRRSRSWPALIGFVGAVMLGVFAWRTTRTPSRPTPTNTIDAASQEPILRIEDVPASPTKSEAARAKFREAMRSSVMDSGRRGPLLDEAIADDPSFASAHLQRAYESFTTATGLDPKGREAVRHAGLQRDALSARDRAVLDAIAPAFLDPPDLRSTISRFSAFVAERPRDVQGQEALGISLGRVGKSDEARRTFQSELELEPGLPLPSMVLAHYLFAEQRETEGVRLLDECALAHPMSTDCLFFKALHYAAQGRCNDADAVVRNVVVINPESEQAAYMRATTAASTGASLEAVGELLRRRRQLAEPSFQASMTGGDEFILGLRDGDFPRALRGIDLSNRDQTTISAVAHSRALSVTRVLWEMGESRKAADLALAFVKSSQARFRPEHMVFDKTIQLLNFARAAGAVTLPALDKDRSRWLAEWQEREKDGWDQEVKLEAIASAYDSPFLPSNEEVQNAMNRGALLDGGLVDVAGATLPDAVLPLATSYGALLLAGNRLDLAEKQLMMVTRACVLVPDVRALYLLGNVYAKKGDKARACDAYAEIEQMWGHAKPRSLTAEAARAEAKRLECPR